MKAMVQDRYGEPDVLRLDDIDPPVPADDQVLVRVHAAGVNPYDWHHLTGTPYVMRGSSGLRRPTQRVRGLDLAGRVEAVGANVTRFRPGDEVFGMRDGAFAEYVCVREDGMLLPKPANLSFEQAAAVPLAALTAWQGLSVGGDTVHSGQHVLVNGAAGGIGTFAVQLAKALGATVTGVCSTGNLDLVRSLGADEVIDYTRDDFVQGGPRFDLLLDNVGNRTIRDRRAVLRPDGRLVVVSGPKRGKWLGPLTQLIRVRLSRANADMLFTKLDREDLVTVRDLIEIGAVTPVVDRVYPLADLPAALAYVGTGHARAKVVVTM
jgi:NADPH:quinone reductase-like Zn-dependent oxidoreductase